MNFGEQSPFISKSNRGGRGIGVRLWKSLEYFSNYLEKDFSTELPVDGIMLLQQYIKAPQPFIIRCEFVGGKFLYAVKVNTSEGFELCPADNCSQIQNFKTNFEIMREYDNHPIIQQYETFLKSNSIEVCGIEFIKDEHGQIWTIDVNTNTNYNLAAEQKFFGKMTAMCQITSFLCNELYKQSNSASQHTRKWSWLNVHRYFTTTAVLGCMYRRVSDTLRRTRSE